MKQVIKNIKFDLKQIINFGRVIQKLDSKRIKYAMFTNFMLSFSEIVFSVVIINYIINAYKDESFKLNTFVAMMVCALIFQISVWAIESFYYEVVSEVSNMKISEGIHKQIFKALDNVKINKIEQSKYYEKYNFILNDCDNRVKEYIQFIESLCGTIVTLVSLSSVIVIAEPILWIFFVLPVVLDLYVTPKLNKQIFEYDKKRNNLERKGEYAQRVLYLKDYAKDVRLTKITKVILQQYKEYIKGVIGLIDDYGYSIAKKMSMITFSYQVFSFFSVIVIVCLEVKFGLMKMNQGIIIISLFNQVVYSIKNIADLYSECNRQSLYINQVLEFIKKNDYKNDYSDIKEKINKIRVENVSFRYAENSYAVNNISFEVHSGEKIALLGENGSGKSTLVKLLLNFYNPTKGKIYINETNLNNINQKKYVGKVGALLQDFRIFSTTIEKNILHREVKNDSDLVILEDAIRKSGFEEKFKKLNRDKKLQVTKEFDKNGIVLSGGEMQKLGIARAIAKQSDILILDEPTSAMDPIAESEFYKVIEENFKDKIVIFVSHNYSVGAFVDRIIYMKNGEICEMGKHEELIKENGEYAQMFKIQVENFYGKKGE